MSTRFSDELGPRGRRRVAVASAASLLVLAVLGFVAVKRLADQGQLDRELWTRFFDPQVLSFLFTGLRRTLALALQSMALALPLGVLLALARLHRWLGFRVGATVWIEFFRGVPLLLLMIFNWRAFSNLSFFTAALIALVLYNSAQLAEIFRAGILSLDHGQRDAAVSLGLTEGQTMRAVLLPQAVRRMAPAIVSQLVTLLKDTTLASVIAYEELLRRFRLAAKGDIGEPEAILQAFVLAAAVYIVLNLCLSLVARRLEARQRRRFRTGPVDVLGPEDVIVTVEEGAGRS
jgi:glutamate transport system permease protein